MQVRDMAALAILLASTASAAGAAEPLSLPAATERALARSPEVRSAESEVRAARARLEEASLPLASNPELLVGAGPRDNGSSRTLDYEVALSQRVEVGGQRGARMASARAALGAAEARLSAARARLTAGVRELLGKVSAARMRAEVALDAHRFSEQAAEPDAIGVWRVGQPLEIPDRQQGVLVHRVLVVEVAHHPAIDRLEFGNHLPEQSRVVHFR